MRCDVLRYATSTRLPIELTEIGASSLRNVGAARYAPPALGFAESVIGSGYVPMISASAAFTPITTGSASNLVLISARLALRTEVFSLALIAGHVFGVVPVDCWKQLKATRSQ